MRPLLDERKENCGMREAVENGFPCGGRVITGLKAGVNEKSFRVEVSLLSLLAFDRRRQLRCRREKSFRLNAELWLLFSLTPVFRPVTLARDGHQPFQRLTIRVQCPPILTLAAGFT
jgi:hypothetical protein